MQLKPCPFCGAKAILAVQEVGYKKSEYSVYCRCGARFWFMDSKQEAVQAWNRRASDDKP